MNNNEHEKKHNHGTDDHGHSHEYSHKHFHDHHNNSHDHSHGHHDDSHHDHSHDDRVHNGHDHSGSAGKELGFGEKLSILFNHWIEHNDSHKDNYISWAEKAENENMHDTAALLRQAAAASDTVTDKLEKALNVLKGGEKNK